METARIEDDDVVYEFQGERVAYVSTRLDSRDRQRARWFEGEIWRRDQGGYVFHRVTLSTVWHLPSGESHVRKPLHASRSDLAARVVYCGVLPARPGREQCPVMGLEESRRAIPEAVVTEAPQRRVWSCPGPSAVLSRMIMARDRDDGVTSAALSGPMRELWEQAVENDPAFRTAGKPVVAL